MEMDKSVNVFGEKLIPCSFQPVTGFFRNGCCDTNASDLGSHTVCVELTESFLGFSKSRGNDLSTPMPQWDFPGLKEGDQWCLCAERWLEAYREGMAPKVHLKSTHKKALEIIPLETLERFAVDE
ncbi:MAG TPA: DUF2237 domain-containing protein [Leptospiraceae bacterium]|nr:DUF2237 domain-containing protein [Leptospiraceae bacterium]HMY67428.1 DUF2237 domain-containing protein [Leptospiraceae bacterium]HNI27685.1 DUF2237 domain-containing protein [Leptospiraceae bacterium]HNN06472.1 DUF2237 domain-containing protein [Leptospiraceae bacterium]